MPHPPAPLRPLLALLVALVALVVLAAPAAGQSGRDGVVLGTGPGGCVGPAGQEVQLDLPLACRRKNTVGTDGSGLCVFASGGMAAWWCSEVALQDVQKYMERYPGGGYPEKVDRVFAKKAPNVKYVQHTAGDMEFVYAVVRSGRFICNTYAGRDMRYGWGVDIAHMVCTAHYDPPGAAVRWLAVLDCNFPDRLIWLTEAEYAKRWKAMGGGWAYALLAAGAAPVPRNLQPAPAPGDVSAAWPRPDALPGRPRRPATLTV